MSIVVVLLRFDSNVHEDTKNLHELLAMDPVIVSIAKAVQRGHRADRRSGVPRPWYRQYARVRGMGGASALPSFPAALRSR